MFGVARQDVRSVTGGNLALLKLETGLDPASACLGQIKGKLRENTNAVPIEAKWRVRFLAKLLCQRGEAYYEGEDTEMARLSCLIDSLCIN